MEHTKSLSYLRESRVIEDQNLWDFPKPSNNTFLQWETRNTELLLQILSKIFLECLKEESPDWVDVFEIRYERKDDTISVGGVCDVTLVINKPELDIEYDTAKNTGTIIVVGSTKQIHEVRISRLLQSFKEAIRIATIQSKRPEFSMLGTWSIQESTHPDNLFEFTVVASPSAKVELRCIYKVVTAIKTSSNYLFVKKDYKLLPRINTDEAVQKLADLHIGFFHLEKVILLFGDAWNQQHINEEFPLKAYKAIVCRVAEKINTTAWKDDSFLNLFRMVIDKLFEELEAKSIPSWNEKKEDNLIAHLKGKDFAPLKSWWEKKKSLDAPSLLNELQQLWQQFCARFNVVETETSVKSSKISVLRDASNDSEKNFWDFAQYKLVPDEDDIVQQKIDAALLLPRICATMKNKIRTNPYLVRYKDLIEPYPVLVGSNLNDTNILGSDNDIVIVLSEQPVKFAKNKRNQDNWFVGDQELHENAINSVAACCRDTIELLRTSGDFNVTHAPKDSTQKLVFELQTTQRKIEYDILPVFRTFDGAFLVITNNKFNLSHNEAVAAGLHLLATQYHGLFEIIKVCKLFSKEWNARQETKDNGLRIPSSVWESAAVHMIQEEPKEATEPKMERLTSTKWNEMTALELFKKFFEYFDDRVKNDKEVPVLNNKLENLIKGLSGKDKTKLIQWIQEKRAFKSTEQLYKEALNMWKILKGETIDPNNPVPNAGAGNVNPEPTTNPSPTTPKTNPSSTTPATNPSPVTNPNPTTPETNPSSTTPATNPSPTTPATDSSPKTPETNPSSATPATNLSPLTPKTNPSSTTPATDSSPKTRATSSRSAQPPQNQDKRGWIEKYWKIPVIAFVVLLALPHSRRFFLKLLSRKK